MRTRFICDDFELDVSDLELSWTEENTWFKEDFFLSSSFPFEMDYTKIPFFLQYKHDNLANSEIWFQGKLEKDGRIEDAILEVEEASDKLQLVIRYGTEALPNWTKKLSELDLDIVLPEGGSMRTHANAIVNKTWPEVNYNFPAIHTKFYDSSPMFGSFEGTLNKRENGQFISNIADGANTKNRNIVYPFPYHLYVLQAAVEDAGCTLHGDILSDPDLQDAIIIPPHQLANFEGIPQPIEWFVYEIEFEQQSLYFQFISEQQINMRGQFHLRSDYLFPSPYFQRIRLWLNDELIYQNEHNTQINLWFETTELTNTLKCEVILAFPFPVDFFGNAAEFTLSTLYLTDEDGEMLPFLADFSNVQLSTALPDMTVGDFFKFHKRLKNYDLELKNNNEVWMNLVQNEVANSEIIDISKFEPPTKTRKYEQAKAFVLQYEGDYEDYHFTKVLASMTGYEIDSFIKPENAAEININGIPLPIETINGIKTAVQISDDSSKLMIVRFPGLVNSENWTQAMPGLDTYKLYINHWQRWLNFIIHAVKFHWTIKAHPNELMRVFRKSKLFSFNNLMFVFTLNRRRSKDVEEVEIEAYSSKV